MGSTSVLTFSGFLWDAHQAARARRCWWAAAEPAAAREAGLPVRFRLGTGDIHRRQDTLARAGTAVALVQTDRWRAGPPRLQLEPLRGSSAVLLYHCQPEREKRAR